MGCFQQSEKKPLLSFVTMEWLFFIINNIKAGAGVIESDEVIAFFFCVTKREIYSTM